MQLTDSRLFAHNRFSIFWVAWEPSVCLPSVRLGVCLLAASIGIVSPLFSLLAHGYCTASKGSDIVLRLCSPVQLIYVCSGETCPKFSAVSRYPCGLILVCSAWACAVFPFPSVSHHYLCPLRWWMLTIPRLRQAMAMETWCLLWCLHLSHLSLVRVQQRAVQVLRAAVQHSRSMGS